MWNKKEMAPRLRIQSIREERALTREQLARRMRTSRRWIWRIETGATKLLVDDLPRFARALSVEIAELVA